MAFLIASTQMPRTHHLCATTASFPYLSNSPLISHPKIQPYSVSRVTASLIEPETKFTACANGTVCSTAGHEDQEREERYSSNLSLTSALDGGGWSMPRLGRFTPKNDPVTTVQKAGWAPRPIWTAVENLAPIGTRSPDRPASSQSIYRLRHPGPPRHVV